MVTHFCQPGGLVGCDFCGIVEETAAAASSGFPPGTRVCGGICPYSPDGPLSGAFAQWAVADSRLILRVSDSVGDLEAAALGGVGWGTPGMAFYDPGALALQGTPSNPTSKGEPVLVYGGATVSGTMATQLLKLSGYTPIAITSPASSLLAMEYGALGTASYTSPKCVEITKSLANGIPNRHALDCITNRESVATCFASMARAGGCYACLEGLDTNWLTRRSVKTKEVMGFEGLGHKMDFGPSAPKAYSREANVEAYIITARWTAEMQVALDGGLMKAHPVQDIPGGLKGIIDGLGLLQRGEVKGQKLVVRIATV